MKKADAYFTVEAALVMPMVLGVIVFIIYLFFFQYDRCLMEQNAQVLAMRGCTIQITDRRELAQELLRQSEGSDVSRYLAFETDKAEIVIRGSQVTVKQSGILKFPFYKLVPGNSYDVWETETCFVNHRISPVNFVRNCKKIIGGK